MQLLHALALVAALCMGSGAASDLRGAVRAGVDSNKNENDECLCNLAGPGVGAELAGDHVRVQQGVLQHLLLLLAARAVRPPASERVPVPRLDTEYL
jgi:hypothetical protein